MCTDTRCCGLPGPYLPEITTYYRSFLRCSFQINLLSDMGMQTLHPADEALFPSCSLWIPLPQFPIPSLHLAVFFMFFWNIFLPEYSGIFLVQSHIAQFWDHVICKTSGWFCPCEECRTQTKHGPHVLVVLDA